jgi:hypothetical protein
VSSDFYLFGPFKNFDQEKDLRTETYCNNSCAALASLGKEHYHERIFELVKQQDECLNARDDYVEK